MPKYNARVNVPRMRAGAECTLRIRVHPILGPDEVTAQLLDPSDVLEVQEAWPSVTAVNEVNVRFFAHDRFPGGQVRLRIEVLTAEEQLEAQGSELAGDDDDDFDDDESDEDDDFFD